MIGDAKNSYAKQVFPLEAGYEKYADAAHVGKEHWDLNEKEAGSPVQK